MPENVQRINYFIKLSRILFMCNFSRKLFRWNFSEQNVKKNNEKTRENVLWSNEGRV